MLRTTRILGAALAMAVAASLALAPGLRADEASEHGPQDVITPLLQTGLAGVDGKEVNILHISVDPGFVTAHHYHPGQLFLYVLEGSVTIEVDGMAPVELGPGDVFEEPPGTPMVARNPSTTHGAELLVLQIGDEGEPLTVDTE